MTAARALRLRDPAAAARLIRAGRLVAFPTETVYGLGADGLSARAVRSIFTAKGRPPDNPLILHVADARGAAAVAEWNPRADELARRYWPGPLTLVLPARPRVPGEVTAGLPTVAVRCPDHPMAQALIAAVGGPVAAPSANRSGGLSPTDADAVFDELGDRIDAVLDGGPCRYGLESTVVDCTGAPLRLLRAGAVAGADLGLPDLPDPEAPIASPGMSHRHYAPDVPVVLTEDVGRALSRWPDAAVLCLPATAERLHIQPSGAAALWPEDPSARGAALFRTLRSLAAAGRPRIIVEALPPLGRDAATMDRLRRAESAVQDSAAGGGTGGP